MCRIFLTGRGQSANLFKTKILYHYVGQDSLVHNLCLWTGKIFLSSKPDHIVLVGRQMEQGIISQPTVLVHTVHCV